MVVKSDAKQLLSKLNTLLLVDDWYGTGTTMFAVQFLLNSLTEKPLATECATPGIAQDQHALEGKNAINNILTAMKNNSQSPPAAN
jgi:hypothetical protein